MPGAPVNVKVVATLIEEGVDLAIRIARDLVPGLAVRPLCIMRYVLVASQDYLARHTAPTTPEALREHRCSHLGYGSIRDYSTLRGGDTSVNISVPASLTINNSAAILAMVEAGGGIGLVPDFTARAALHGQRVQQILPGWEFCAPIPTSLYTQIHQSCCGA
jgi:DNA-binding transcriptional LysR family regulator